MDIDKLIQLEVKMKLLQRFGSLMDIDKLILQLPPGKAGSSFGSLMDIDKLILRAGGSCRRAKFWFSDGY